MDANQFKNIETDRFIQQLLSQKKSEKVSEANRSWRRPHIFKRCGLAKQNHKEKYQKIASLGD